jgi:hypothetical protein
VGNNPINATDPQGLEESSIIAFFGNILAFSEWLEKHPTAALGLTLGTVALTPEGSGILEKAGAEIEGESTVVIDLIEKEGAAFESKACNMINAIRLRIQLAAQEIAGGHAFDKHKWQNTFRTRAELADFIKNVMSNPSETRVLSNGRIAYWDKATQTVVIRTPSAIDGGTVFMPKSGKTYFDNLK